MSILSSVKEFLEASTESANRGDARGPRSKGAYWCHDCGERLRDLDLDNESDDEAPRCPECGQAMEFERSPSSTGCAC